MIEYAYVIGSLLIGLPLWSVLYWYRKDLRKEQLIVSILVACLAPIWELWFLGTYWLPPTSPWFTAIGDFCYGFFFGGIAAVVYEVVYGERYAKRHDSRYRWILFLPLILVVGVCSFNIPVIHGLNPIYAAFLLFLIMAAMMIIFRQDLLIDAVASGLLVGLITFVMYLILHMLFPEIFSWWNRGVLTGISISNIPLEELLWAFGMGLTVGPLYEFFFGLRFVKRI